MSVDSFSYLFCILHQTVMTSLWGRSFTSSTCAMALKPKPLALISGLSAKNNRLKKDGCFCILSYLRSAKYFFVRRKTIGERIKRAMKLGMAMRPLKVSAMFQTKSRLETAPTMMTQTKMA